MRDVERDKDKEEGWGRGGVSATRFCPLEVNQQGDPLKARGERGGKVGMVVAWLRYHSEKEKNGV